VLRLVKSFRAESAFFADLVHYVSHWVHELGKNVYVVGLSGDARMRPFGEILDCIALSVALTP
jgi:hypothetical protein